MTPADEEENGERRCTLSVVIPTFNERGNIRPLVAALDRVLGDEQAEYIFVDDDSPDGTGEEVRRLAQVQRHVRLIERIGRRGLASACAEGVSAGCGDWVLVMDGDLQHDEGIIPELLRAVREEGYDVASGTRFGTGKEVEGLSQARTVLSRVGNQLARLVSGQKLADPMSGFFLFRRDDFLAALPRMACTGYKIYFDFLCSAVRKLRVKEVEFRFRTRQEGESKLGMAVLWEAVLLLMSKLSRGLLPVRFIGFGLVGLSGVVLHLSIVFGLFRVGPVPYVQAQSVATVLAMVWNYYWNNRLTYAEVRQKGASFFGGLGLFMAISGCGALINVVLAKWLYELSFPWVVCSVVGIVFGSVWNYALSRWMIWRKASM